MHSDESQCLCHCHVSNSTILQGGLMQTDQNLNACGPCISRALEEYWPQKIIQHISIKQDLSAFFPPHFQISDGYHH